MPPLMFSLRHFRQLCHYDCFLFFADAAFAAMPFRCLYIPPHDADAATVAFTLPLS